MRYQEPWKPYQAIEPEIANIAKNFTITAPTTFATPAGITITIFFSVGESHFYAQTLLLKISIVCQISLLAQTKDSKAIRNKQ